MKRERVILVFAWFFGGVNIPFALLGIVDLSGGLFFEGFPSTAVQWLGFLTITAVIAGAVAGITAKIHHSMSRKIIHAILSVFPIIWLSVLYFTAPILLP